MTKLKDKRILLVIGGGIAAYKCLELIRLLKKAGASVSTVMTKAAQEFVTPLAVGALSHEPVFSELFDRQAEEDIGHIRLSRQTDLIVVAPATADRMARLAAGLADDLAGAVLLASDKPVLLAPAMNPRMWAHPATRRNVAQLHSDGYGFMGPEAGEMAERDESGEGRMSEPQAIFAEIVRRLGSDVDTSAALRPLSGRRVLVTSGPTHEPIDPVRYLANRSSGRQGHAIAAAFARAGAHVTLVSGPVTIPAPEGVDLVAVETAREMLAAVEAALPVDIAVLAAAVADWRTAEEAERKLKKTQTGAPALTLVENPDILATLSRHEMRPRLVVGFAAETNDVVAHARAKLQRKGCDFILANDVSPATGIMGGTENAVQLIGPASHEEWPRMSKEAVAERLVAQLGSELATKM
ncbi:bifunctional phosphopantothenoylcysteine decarboxylase/phosphopantothenate--cysteine ligase CoaBC [Afifella marina]|uniref:Coenzyme A biosynthesis bifunctional protein CoaBC n=1 Tax=Afifella marina DSM 2698 TaxID=1120955 RepID=A0A1G5NCC6_AFIMA|nr:bifunctional phosphopantothenoylcysteine decarboxylase/phosphopantothenate--cysteine ligase CoaBC [Afifella marina]MBK1623283.1 bifunctional phosphopantothenoylcysteine decarboxylase/phosphopantothenate--cysteine ligase CoaBC [Afifella marina DSM 2698]MBK1626277.1 bifunctional phosphopantothenoylcysteine decarboxylase/phosphopantothenate--cysteine ligase CoaBC [Afifella marina]MBK5917155.1 bifunctional phosphopantothenoylcysteine decarboxylase/phosphopantothenate synthase [Afifella marina]RA